MLTELQHRKRQPSKRLQADNKLSEGLSPMELKSAPKISVIIPVYNVEKYLRDCLNSVSAQTFTDWEAICVNDGSTDNCKQILEQHAAGDNRFIIINQPNSSVSVARNNGLKHAKGEYIYFLDSDDLLHPQCLEIAYNSAVKHQAELVCFGFFKNKTGNFVPQKYDTAKIKEKITNNPLFFQNRHRNFKIHFNVWTKFYKRELLDGLEFIPKINFQDYPHTYAVLLRKPKTVILDAKLYAYATNLQSISYLKTDINTIKNYETGLFYVCNLYKQSANKKEFKFIQHHLIPKILSVQLLKCKSLPNAAPEIWQAFASEISELDKAGLLHWRGHNLKNYFTYKKLIKEYTHD